MKSFNFINIPARADKPRKLGMTMVLDKKMSPSDLEAMLSISADYIDIVKFGWGSSRLFDEEALKYKLELIKQAGVISCVGGTLFEIAYAQNAVDEFFKFAKEYGFESVEISDGVVPIPFEDKIELIKAAKSYGFIVFSEVGKKDTIEDRHLLLDQRIEQIREELNAGSFKVVLEAREHGEQGIYDDTGEVIPGLVDELIATFGLESLIFEAPLSSQQVWLINNLGNTVNLGNINPDDCLSVETLRTGLRAGTTRQYHLDHIFVFIENGISGALHASERNDIMIVVDALRASSTITTAIASGMKSVQPVTSAEECIGAVTAGERGGTKIDGLMHDNSPMQFRDEKLKGKSLVLTSTNGTECIKVASSNGGTVLIGCLLNAKAVAAKAQEMAKKERKNISILMAGRNNKIASDDLLAASEIMSNLRDCSLKGYIKPVFSDNLETDFLNSGSGKNLVSLGKREDVVFCAQTDIYDVVPIFDGKLIR